MLPYYLLIVPIAAMASFAAPRRLDYVAWSLAFGAIVIFVGLRHHVGMDWNNYLIMIERANRGNLWESFNHTEPGFAILLWVSGQNGWGVYGTYFLGTIIFAAGLFRYAKITPSPWMALLVAMPYLTIVVAMAAARQSIAIGVLFWLVAEWDDCPLWKRIALILFAAAFHSSAVIFVVFVFLDLKSHPAIKAIGAVITGVCAFYFLKSSGQAEYYDQAYVSGQTDLTRSTGAIIHVMLNGAPAAIAFLVGPRMRQKLIPNKLLRNMAIVAIMLVPLSLVVSTASSRMTLYLFPVSMWIFAAFADLFVKSNRVIVRCVLSTCFVALLAVWLNYANNSNSYKTYQNALLLSARDLRLCCK